MIPITAAEIADAVGGELTPALTPDTRAWAPVVVDSREVTAGGVFVAFAGENVDGHQYLSAAIDAGAVLVISEQETSLPAILVDDTQLALGMLARTVLDRLPDVTVIGVTGSVGKTTTKDLLSQLLSPHAPTIAPVGSFNNEIGLPLTVLRADEKTSFLILEMGASGIGHLDYLTNIAPPDISVILCVGRAHVGEFGGIEAIAQAKSELVTGTKNGGVTILNGDDAQVAAMAKLANKDGYQRQVMRFSMADEGSGFDVTAQDIEIDPQGRAHFTLVADSPARSLSKASVQLQLVGAHQIPNALAAASVSCAVGIDIDTTAKRLSAALPLSEGRMSVTDREDGVTVIDDSYNANPDSTTAALEALALIGEGKRTWAILGEMLELGDESVAAHQEIGAAVASRNIDRFIAVGAVGPSMADAAIEQGMKPEAVICVSDVDSAYEVLEQNLEKSDVLLVKASHGAGLWQLGKRLVIKQEAR